MTLAPLQNRDPALTPLLLQVCAWGLEARSAPEPKAEVKQFNLTLSKQTRSLNSAEAS